MRLASEAMAWLLCLLALVPGADAYAYTAAAVNGRVVLDAGNLTLGGKIGTYTVLLQVLNPSYGDLELLLECCGLAAPLAGTVSTMINMNEFVGDESGSVVDKVKERFVGKGCSAPSSLESLVRKGDPTCDYVYGFQDKMWKRYAYSAYCVPSDVCAVDVVGQSKGLKAGYGVVLQVLNQNAGDLVYAGSGLIGDCLSGMNLVNMANLSGFKQTVPRFIDIFGHKIPAGEETNYRVPGMTQQGFLEMLQKCKPNPATGMLYVFKNRYWNEEQKTLNISDFIVEQQKAQDAKDLQALLNHKAAPAGELTTEPPQAVQLTGLGGALAGLLKAGHEAANPYEAQSIIDEAEKKAVEKAAVPSVETLANQTQAATAQVAKAAEETVAQVQAAHEKNVEKAQQWALEAQKQAEAVTKDTAAAVKKTVADVQAAHEKNMAAAEKVAEEAQAAVQEAADAFVGGGEQAKELGTSAAEGASELGEMMHQAGVTGRRLLI